MPFPAKQPHCPQTLHTSIYSRQSYEFPLWILRVNLVHRPQSRFHGPKCFREFRRQR